MAHSLLADREGGSGRLSRFWQFLRLELAPFPGRREAMIRTVVCAFLVMVISLSLQIPFLMLSLIMVFFCAQENSTYTQLAGSLMLVGTTLGTVILLVLFNYTFDLPLLRILGAGLIVFAGMFFLRVSPLGSIGYMLSVSMVYAQTFVEQLPYGEPLLRLALWSWVAGGYATVLTILVNKWLLPAEPRQLLREEMVRQLDGVQASLGAMLSGTSTPAISVQDIERGVLALRKHLKFAEMTDASYKANRAQYLMCISTLDRLHTAAAQMLAQDAETLTPDTQVFIPSLQRACRRFRRAINAGREFRLSAPLVVPLTAPAIIRELGDALNAQSLAADTFDSPATEEKTPLLVPDALTNPVYPRFALKAVLASLICYTFYSAVDWEGIHTCMITCIILALPSVGATSQKALLRVGGCLVGSLFTLLAVLYVIPYLDGLTGFLLLSLPIIAVAAWVAAGSERINYAGLQIAFAYALAMFGSSGPTMDLTEIRDRIVGILVGIVVATVVYSLLWPEREGRSLQEGLTKLLRSLAQLATVGSQTGTPEQRLEMLGQVRLQCLVSLAQSRERQTRVSLEPEWSYTQGNLSPVTQQWLAQAQALLFALNQLQTLRIMTPTVPEPWAQASTDFSEAVAALLTAWSQRLEHPSSTEYVVVNSILTSATKTLYLLGQSHSDEPFVREWLMAVREITTHLVKLDIHIVEPVLAANPSSLSNPQGLFH